MDNHFDNLIVKVHEKWFTQYPSPIINKGSPPLDMVTSMKAEAQNLLDSQEKRYRKLRSNRNDKDYAWATKILQAGTLSDKVAAHTLFVQQSPIFNISSLETLIGMVTIKGKRECMMAMESLLDLFTGNLLIEDRKLRFFNEQCLDQLDTLSKGVASDRKKFLLLWIFEDTLKNLYKKFVENVVSVSNDTVEKTKMKAASAMFRLLRDVPEQEQFLLEKLVNKIGDSVPKIGSHVCYLLGQLLEQHSQMKEVVVKEVERFLFRQHLSDRAQYYALCFLNQIILSPEDSELSKYLIILYFGKFKLFVKKGEVNTKMMSALLTGVSRAYPYAKLKEDVIVGQLDAMYRLVHMVSFNVSIQALMLIFQVLDSSYAVSDRFYSTLYRKLLDPAFRGSSRQASVLNLVYRALKKDTASIRVKAFVKRLLQIALYQAPNLQCGILVLVSEVLRNHPTVFDVKTLKLEDSDSDEHYEDVADEIDDDDDDKNKECGTKIEIKEEKPSISSWVHRTERKNSQISKSAYDFNCRNPLRSNVESQDLWELLLLRQSFHPSVSLFSHQVSKGHTIKYSGDPLLDFTTSRFLDRFVYRNPKQPSDAFQQNVKTRVFGKRGLKVKEKLPVMSDKFLQQKKERVPAEEKFLYEYLQKHKKGSKKDDEGSDIESVTSEDFQMLLDEVHPEVDGEDTLNFAKELKLHKLQKGKKRKVSDDENDSDDDEMESDDLDDVDLDDELEMEDFDHEDVEDFEDTDDIDDKLLKKNKKSSSSSLDSKLLASADEFSAMLEDNAGSNIDTTTGEAFRIKDKSGAKQIAWEMERHRYVQGTRWQDRKRFRKNKRHKK